MLFLLLLLQREGVLSLGPLTLVMDELLFYLAYRDPSRLSVLGSQLAVLLGPN